MNDLSRLSRAAPPASVEYLPFVVEAAATYDIPMAVLLAIGERESRWGLALSPRGPAGTGDGGRGHGLMQIDVGSFSDWIATGAWRDPRQNILKGAEVLAAKRKYLTSRPRTPTVTLDSGAAARREVQAGTYRDPRPLAGDALLRASIAAYNTGELNSLRSVAVGVDPDATTTGKDYSAWVLRRAAEIEAAYNTAPTYA